MFDLPRKRAPVVRCPDADGWCRDVRDFPRTFPERERKKKRKPRASSLASVLFFTNSSQWDRIHGRRIERRKTNGKNYYYPALLLRSKGGRWEWRAPASQSFQLLTAFNAGSFHDRRKQNFFLPVLLLRSANGACKWRAEGIKYGKKKVVVAVKTRWTRRTVNLS